VRYIIGLLGLVLIIFVIVQLIRFRKVKGGKLKYVAYLILGIILSGWGLASTKATFAGVAVTEKQSAEITKLTDAQGKVVHEFAGNSWNYSKVASGADSIKKPYKYLNKKANASILTTAVRDIKSGAKNENSAAKQYALNAVQRLNKQTAKSITGSSSSKDYQRVYKQLQTNSGLSD